jgi:hypothetical protein
VPNKQGRLFLEPPLLSVSEYSLYGFFTSSAGIVAYRQMAQANICF